MISQGEYYRCVPTEVAANLRFRKRLLVLCREEPKYRRAVVEMCRRDLFFYTAAFVWQYNPKMMGREVGPFIPWPAQERVMRRTLERLYRDEGDVVWEKSRYQGATWWALIKDDWLARFHANKKFLWISHSEQAVDRSGDPDSLFWKLAFIQRHMPDWMPAARKSRLKVSYGDTDSTITGASTSERSGVGGRATSVGLDEFSKQREDREILGQTADTGPRLFIGTHYGVGTAFYDLTQRPDMAKEILHWSENPYQNAGLYESYPDSNEIKVLDTGYAFPEDYAFVHGGNASGGGPYPFLRSPWYDRECVRRASTRDVAMHLDINPSGSQSQFFDALTIRKLAAGCVAPYWEGDLEYDPDRGTPLRLRAERGGPLKLWVHPTGDCAVPPSKYGCGNDCAAGMGRTPSVCSMVDARTGAKVLEYATPFLPPEKFAAVVVSLCRLFHDALLNWEDKGPGLQFGKQVGQLGYRKLWPRDGASIVRGKAATTLYGWVPGIDTKRRMLDSYRAALYDRAFVNRSELAVLECLNYRYSDRRDAVEHPRDIDGDDPSGAKSNHGDRVIADALAWLACVKLGAGVVGGPADKPLVVAPVGSLGWRMELAESRQRVVQDRHPIRRRA